MAQLHKNLNYEAQVQADLALSHGNTETYRVLHALVAENERLHQAISNHRLAWYENDLPYRGEVGVVNGQLWSHIDLEQEGE